MRYTPHSLEDVEFVMRLFSLRLHPLMLAALLGGLAPSFHVAAAGSDWIAAKPSAVLRDGECWRMGNATPGDRCSEPATFGIAPNAPSPGEWDENHYNPFFVDEERLLPNVPAPRLREAPSGFPGPVEPELLPNIQ